MTNCNNSNCGNCGTHHDRFISAGQSGTSTGDSRKYRIGNDINLDITINELNGMQIINIKSIQCFIKNTTPGMDPHNHHDIPRIGLPMYHALPQNRNYGYGMYPGVPNFHRLYPNYDYVRHFDPHWHLPQYHMPLVPVHKHNPFEFNAPVKALEARNKVRVYFPAAAQLLCGLYSLTFVIQLFEPGYHCNNLRTVTVDYNNVFELVPNMEGATGAINIDLDKEIGFNNFTGSTVSNTESGLIESINIIGPNDITVGDIETYVADVTPNSNSISWRINLDNAKLGNITSNSVQVLADYITDIEDGKNVVTLECIANDGSGVIARKDILLHNYCTRVDFGNCGDVISLQPGQSIEAQMIATQEDGTRLAMCEMLAGCQAIPAVEYTLYDVEDACVLVKPGDSGMTCEWQYDDTAGGLSDNITTNVHSGGNCCNDCASKLLIKNVSKSEYEKTAWLKLSSRLKGANGNSVDKYIKIVCLGKKTGSDEPVDPGQDETYDTYINGGRYDSQSQDVVFTMNNHSDVRVNISPLLNDDVTYWHN